MNYLEFITLNGRPLSDINIGSDEIATDVNIALEAIEILKNNNTPILGGDVLTTKLGQLKYAYQVWGDEYIYLEWYCEKKLDESKNEYLLRSYNFAIESIKRASIVSQKFDMDCFIVLVI